MSAWAARQGLVLGQEATDAESNEITAIPLLLERLEPVGVLVTVDAIGTQTAIADVIVRRGGDYLLALKANRPATHDDVASVFADPPPGLVLSTHTTADAEHGCVEERRHIVCHDVAWMWSDRRCPDELSFPHLDMIGMVEARVERGGKVQNERRHCLSSTKVDDRTFANAVRTHWHIEDRLHWTLDVVFHDDLVGL